MIQASEVPSFADLSDQFAVVVHGRPIAGAQEGELTNQQIQDIAAQVKGWREELDLPVALVTSQGWLDAQQVREGEFFGDAILGIVIECQPAGQRPKVLQRAAIESVTAPSALWERAEAAGISVEGEDTYWVTATGWSQALLMSGELDEEEDLEPEDDWEGDVDGEELLLVSSEDTDPSLALDLSVLDGDPAYFWCVYI